MILTANVSLPYSRIYLSCVAKKCLTCQMRQLGGLMSHTQVHHRDHRCHGFTGTIHDIPLRQAQVGEANPLPTLPYRLRAGENALSEIH
jgi:hypothetical protein